jgi:hypothetical protein
MHFFCLNIIFHRRSQRVRKITWNISGPYFSATQQLLLDVRLQTGATWAAVPSDPGIRRLPPKQSLQTRPAMITANIPAALAFFPSYILTIRR